MTVSMTGFASRQGAYAGYSWTWDLRSVNGRGLDLRLRVPDWIEGLEQALRAHLQKALKRGSIQLSLRVTSRSEESTVSVSDAALEAALKTVAKTQNCALKQGIELKPSSAAEVLSIRGVMDQNTLNDDTGALKNALLSDFEPVVTALVEMRKSEGKALRDLIEAQLLIIEELHTQAAAAAVKRAEEAPQILRQQIAKVVETTDAVDPDRLAQEIALLAVKADVTEELDRLSAHIGAARAILEKEEPQGRKLDFLVQEFNREANTLCSKSGTTELTGVGLDLKTVIDQMREQVQNVE